MRIGEIKRYARASLKGKWGLAVLLTLVTGIIYIGFSTAVQEILSLILKGASNNVVADIGSIVDFLLIPLIMGYFWVFLKIVRNESATFGNVFDGYSNGSIFGKGVGLGALVTLYTTLWFLLLIVPGIIKSIAYSQSYFIYKDFPDYGINEIITESRRIMKGYKWKFFLLQFSFIGWAILAIFTLGIGLLWLYPYMAATMARFYDELPKHPHDKGKSEIIL